MKKIVFSGIGLVFLQVFMVIAGEDGAFRVKPEMLKVSRSDQDKKKSIEAQKFFNGLKPSREQVKTHGIAIIDENTRMVSGIDISRISKKDIVSDNFNSLSPDNYHQAMDNVANFVQSQGLHWDLSGVSYDGLDDFIKRAQEELTSKILESINTHIQGEESVPGFLKTNVGRSVADYFSSMKDQWENLRKEFNGDPIKFLHLEITDQQLRTMNKADLETLLKVNQEKLNQKWDQFNKHFGGQFANRELLGKLEKEDYSNNILLRWESIQLKQLQEISSQRFAQDSLFLLSDEFLVPGDIKSALKAYNPAVVDLYVQKLQIMRNIFERLKNGSDSIVDREVVKSVVLPILSDLADKIIFEQIQGKKIKMADIVNRQEVNQLIESVNTKLQKMPVKTFLALDEKPSAALSQMESTYHLDGQLTKRSGEKMLQRCQRLSIQIVLSILFATGLYIIAFNKHA